MPVMNARKCLMLGLACGVLQSTALADTLSLKVENDTFSRNSDGHYSNGFEVFWSFEPESQHWSRRFTNAMPGWSDSDVSNVSYRGGHQIYTPFDINYQRLIINDRPYAGLFFLGGSIFANEQLDGWRKARGLHLDVGMVGPAAGAEKIQRAVHKVTDSDEPRGWEHQLRNEPFINVGYNQRWWKQNNLLGLDIEYGPSAGLTLGNLYTYASTGLGLRFGHRLDRSFSIPSVTPGRSGSQFFTAGNGMSWYLFADLEGRYMAQNMLLDGNTWKDSHSVDREEWVGDAKVGLAFTMSTWQVALAQVWRTKEFKTQHQHDQFGSITLSKAF